MSQVSQPNADSTSHFDADALAAAQEAPTMTVGGFLYRGRLLSIEEWMPWWDRLTALRKGREQIRDSQDDAKAFLVTLLQFYRDYLRVIFPRTRFRFWAPDPVEHLMRQPYVVIEEAMDRFFSLQERATFGESVRPNPIPSALPGQPSQPAIPSGPGEG